MTVMAFTASFPRRRESSFVTLIRLSNSERGLDQCTGFPITPLGNDDKSMVFNAPCPYLT